MGQAADRGLLSSSSGWIGRILGGWVMRRWKEWHRGSELLDAWHINEAILKAYIREETLVPHNDNLEPLNLGPNGAFEWTERKETYSDPNSFVNRDRPPRVMSVRSIRHRIDVLTSW